MAGLIRLVAQMGAEQEAGQHELAGKKHSNTKHDVDGRQLDVL
jgi:hypothetical protein